MSSFCLICFQLQTLIPAQLSFEEDSGRFIHLLRINSFLHKDMWSQLTMLSNPNYNFVHVAFHSARILRAFRIAARLGLSISKQTETAIRKLS